MPAVRSFPRSSTLLLFGPIVAMMDLETVKIGTQGQKGSRSRLAVPAPHHSRLSPVLVVGIEAVLERVQAGEPLELRLGDALEQPVAGGEQESRRGSQQREDKTGLAATAPSVSLTHIVICSNFERGYSKTCSRGRQRAREWWWWWKKQERCTIPSLAVARREACLLAGCVCAP